MSLRAIIGSEIDHHFLKIFNILRDLKKGRIIIVFDVINNKEYCITYLRELLEEQLEIEIESEFFGEEFLFRSVRIISSLIHNGYTIILISNYLKENDLGDFRGNLDQLSRDAFKIESPPETMKFTFSDDNLKELFRFHCICPNCLSEDLTKHIEEINIYRKGEIIGQNDFNSTTFKIECNSCKTIIKDY